MICPDASAQFRPLALTVTPAMTGYRLAFSGGPTFEPVATFPTMEAAWAAKVAAERATGRVR